MGHDQQDGVQVALQKANSSANWNSISSTWRLPMVLELELELELVSIESGLLPEKRSFGFDIGQSNSAVGVKIASKPT